MIYPIYTIGGTPGSGKSTLAKQLATRLGYEHIYAGGILRSWSQDIEHNPTSLPFDQWYASLSTNPSFDHKVDQLVGQAANNKTNLILEGRVGFHFVPQDKRNITRRLYITCDPTEAAKRVATQKAQGQRSEETPTKDIQAQYYLLLSRSAQERIRYENLYAIDITKPEHYDQIIDTTVLTPQQTLEQILKK